MTLKNYLFKANKKVNSLKKKPTTVLNYSYSLNKFGNKKITIGIDEKFQPVVFLSSYNDSVKFSSTDFAIFDGALTSIENKLGIKYENGSHITTIPQGSNQNSPNAEGNQHTSRLFDLFCNLLDNFRSDTGNASDILFLTPSVAGYKYIENGITYMMVSETDPNVDNGAIKIDINEFQLLKFWIRFIRKIMVVYEKIKCFVEEFYIEYTYHAAVEDQIQLDPDIHTFWTIESTNSPISFNKLRLFFEIQVNLKEKLMEDVSRIRKTLALDVFSNTLDEIKI